MNNNIFDIFNTAEQANQHPFFEFQHDKDFKLENDDISTKSPYSYEFNDTSADQDNYQKFLNLNNVNDFDKACIDPSNESCFLQQQLDKKNFNMMMNQQQPHYQSNVNFGINQNSLKQQNQKILLEQNALSQHESSPLTNDEYNKQMQAYNKMIEKSKRIQKREKAKNRQKNQKKVKEQQELLEKNQIKQEVTNNNNQIEDNHPQSGMCSSDEDAIIPHSPTQNIKHETASQMSSSDKIQIKIEEQTTQSTNSAQGQQQQQNGQNVNFENIKDPKERKKQQQKIRNRISAQNSRDRKKIYIQNLESENSKLVGDYQMLQEQIKQLTYQNQALVKELDTMRNQLHNPKNFICGNCHDKSQIQYTNDFMIDEVIYKAEMSTDGSINSSNSSPQRQTNQNNYNMRNMKFGFGGFALLGFMTICCIVTMLGKNNNVSSSESISLYKLPTLETINAANRNLVEQFTQPQEIKMEEEVAVGNHPEILLTMQKQNQELDSTQNSENVNYLKDWAKYRPWLIQIEKLRQNVIQVISDYFRDNTNNRDMKADLPQKNEISLTDVPTMMNVEQPMSFIQQKIFQSQANNAALSNQQLAPANFFNDKVSTLFCPSPYLYQANQQKDSMNQLSQSEWIHLVVPQSNLKSFQLNGDDIMLKKNSTNQALESQNNAMIEMVCRVYKTREIQDSTQIISQNF